MKLILKWIHKIQVKQIEKQTKRDKTDRIQPQREMYDKIVKELKDRELYREIPEKEGGQKPNDAGYRKHCPKEANDE